MNIPNTENILNEFQYWLWIEKLDWNSQVKNLWLEWIVKVSNTDKDWLYLNDTIVTWWSVSKVNTGSTIELNFDSNNLFWDWSDWDLTLNLDWTFWAANQDVYNFNNLYFYATSTRWSIICNNREKPIIINCLWDFTLDNVDIDFSDSFTWYNKATLVNFWWTILEVLWSRWWNWWWWGGWNSWNWWNHSSWWCIREDTTSWTWWTWDNNDGSIWWNWWTWINSGYSWWNADLSVWNWKPWVWYLWWNWWRWYDAWCWLAGSWVWLWATTLWWNGHNWSWTPSGWWWWWWWEWWKWWVSLILNIKWNVNIWSSTYIFNWWNWWNGWNWWDGWNWLYSNWYWAWWWWGWWWGWWGWNWWSLYIHHWWELTFSPWNFQSNWWNWWAWWSAWATEWTLPPYPTWWTWLTWTSWTYQTKKVISAM